jgi:glucosamine 6-phosphate synthetase-like amidotransferase/phosphosugar isomerase protein
MHQQNNGITYPHRMQDIRTQTEQHDNEMQEMAAEQQACQMQISLVNTGKYLMLQNGTSYQHLYAVKMSSIKSRQQAGECTE